jgi:hypothetical protein
MHKSPMTATSIASSSRHECCCCGMWCFMCGHEPLETQVRILQADTERDGCPRERGYFYLQPTISPSRLAIWA